MKKSLLSLLVCVLALLLFHCFFDNDSGSDSSSGGSAGSAGSISGIVQDNAGNGVPGAAVITSDGSYFSLTDSLGAFTLPGLPEGDYSLQIHKYAYLSAVTPTITLAKGQGVKLEGSIVIKSALVTINGTVVGALLAKKAGGKSGPGGIGVEVPGQGITTRTNPDGTFTLTGVNPDASQILAALGGTGWGLQNLNLTPGAVINNVIISIDKEGGSIVGIVKDSAGIPVAGALVQTVGGGVQATTDENGFYRLVNVPSNVPITVSGGPGVSISGLVLNENSQLDGINLAPQKEVIKNQISIKDGLYIVPDTGRVLIRAAVSAAGTSTDISTLLAVFVWDWDNNGTIDTATPGPWLKVSGNSANQIVKYGAITIFGDTISAQIDIRRVSPVPKVTVGQPFNIAPRAQAQLLGDAICQTGGIVSYMWDFNGDGIYDWRRSDAGHVRYRYFRPGLYLASFLVIASSGERDSGTVQITVEGDPAALPTDTILPPEILTPQSGANTGLGFPLQWAGMSADSFTVYIDTKSPPEAIATSGLLDTTYQVTGLLPSTRYFITVMSYKGGVSSISLSVFITTGINRAPVFDSGLFSPADNAVFQSDSVQLQWAAADADGHPLTYTVYIGTGINPPAVYTSISAASAKYAPASGWQHSATYYWAVEVSDGTGKVRSPLRTFTYIAPNKAPVFKVGAASMPSLARDGWLYSVNTPASDEDGHALTYSLLEGPAAITIADSVLSFTPGTADIGTHTVSVVVTDTRGGTDTLSWQLTVGTSAIATLDTLLISNGTIVPAFTPGSAAYAALVADTISAITLTPSATHPGASITVNAQAIASDSTTGPISMNVGVNIINIQVTAADTSFKQLYTLTVTRLASTDSYLTALSLSRGTLTPVFNPAQASYSAAVASTVTQVTLTPSASHTGSQITVNAQTVVSGSTSTPIALVTGPNIITIAVKAQDTTTTRSYTITVNRLEGDASLLALTSVAGPLTPTFNTDTLAYTLTVANSVSFTTITANAASATASLTINGNLSISGAPSALIPLSVGANIIPVTVRAQDTTQSRSYRVTIHRKSADANLLTLTVSDSAIRPLFSSAVTAYTDTVASYVDTFFVTPTASHASAQITVNGSAVTSGTLSQPLALAEGANVITILVKAEDLSFTKTYILTVYRISANAALSNLVTTGSGLTPSFASATYAYSDTVASDTKSITIIPYSTHPGAAITVNGSTLVSGNASPALNLNVGNNTITTVVTAQDGATQLTYTVNVYRRPSTDATLKAIVVSTGTLKPGFNPSFQVFYDTLLSTDSNLTFAAVANHPGATITLEDTVATTDSVSKSFTTRIGLDTFNINVTAQDGIFQKTYMVIVFRPLSPLADLAAFSISKGSLTPGFNPSVLAYTNSIHFFDSVVTITPRTVHPNAIIIVNNTDTVPSDSASLPVTLRFGQDTIKVKVVAEDRASIKTYNIFTTLYNLPPVISGFHDTIIDYGQNFAPLMLDNFVTDSEHTDNQIIWTATVRIGNPGYDSVWVSPIDSLSRMLFVNKLNGWSGWDTVIITATDPRGGSATARAVYSAAAWAQCSTGSSSNIINLFFPSYNTGYAVGYSGIIYKTTNHGKNWVPQTSNTSNDLKGVFFLDDNTGWVAGQGGTIRRTLDGGATWLLPDTAAPFKAFNAIRFTDPLNGWVVGDMDANYSTAMRSTNGGKTWIEANPGMGFMNQFLRVEPKGPDTAVILNDCGVSRTIDSGASYTAPIYTGCDSRLFGLSFVGTTGWVVGQSGAYYKSVNDGVDWTFRDSVFHYDADYKDVHFANDTMGWTVADSMGIKRFMERTMDGGGTWSSAGEIGGISGVITGFGKYDAIINDGPNVLIYGIRPTIVPR